MSLTVTQQLVITAEKIARYCAATARAEPDSDVTPLVINYVLKQLCDAYEAGQRAERETRLAAAMSILSVTRIRKSYTTRTRRPDTWGVDASSQLSLPI